MEGRGRWGCGGVRVEVAEAGGAGGGMEGGREGRGEEGSRREEMAGRRGKAVRYREVLARGRK